MQVGEAPGEYGFDGLALKGDGEEFGVDAGDDAVDCGGVGLFDVLVVDVELGEVYLEAEGFGAGPCPRTRRR